MEAVATESPARSPGLYFALVFLLTVPFWVLGAVVREPLAGVGLPLSALMFVSPLIVALFLIHREEGTQGLRRLFGSFADTRHIRPLWYLPTLLLMPVIYALSHLVHEMLGRSMAPPDLTVLGLLTLLVAFLVTAACEEAGWTGYVTDPLQKRWSALGAALVIGAVWAGLHVIPDLQGGHDWGWIAGQRLFTLALRVLIVWLYNNTGRTLFAPTVLHATDNVGVFTLFPGGGDDYVPAITAVITAIVAIGVTLVWGWRTLGPRRG